jgi:hypothetical protein
VINVGGICIDRATILNPLKDNSTRPQQNGVAEWFNRPPSPNNQWLEMASILVVQET